MTFPTGTKTAAALAAIALGIAGCGGGSHAAKHPVQPVKRETIARACPKRHAEMGCAVKAEPVGSLSRLRAAPRTDTAGACLFPDVSEFQGSVDWGAVAAWQRARGCRSTAIFKVGEYGTDPYASTNARGTAGFQWRAGYWFVRNYGCDVEAARIAANFRALGLRIVALDLEVPEASGYGACLTPRLRADGFIVVEYTAPGSNPGGVDTSAPLWEATYGPSFSPIWHPVVAWQCTDGIFGCVTYVPGIGHDDVSVDLGITGLGAPPPDPFAVFPKTVFRFGRDHASEYNTARTWVGARCRNPVRREVCKSTHLHLQLLLGRDDFVAFNRPAHGGWVRVRPPRWGFPSKAQPIGSRAALIRGYLRQR